MKSQFQILSFLSQYQPKTDADRDMITGFIEKRCRITPKTIIFSPEHTDNIIDAQSFLQWYENGYGASEIAKYHTLVILGDCTTESATIVGTLNGDKIDTAHIQININELEKVSGQDAQKFQLLLLSHNLQFNPDSMSLETKYIPALNEKILFHNYDYSIKGIGIVRNIYPDNYDVELYCYFIYPSKNENGDPIKGSVGYSMHERNIVNLKGYIFEPLLEDEKRFSSDDGISAYRRLKRELEKENKIWKDKIRRIEPVNMRAEKGGKYWYINDKMKVVQEIDKYTPTSQMRYLCGNYFINYDAAVEMLGKFNELIRDYLASKEWPKL